MRKQTLFLIIAVAAVTASLAIATSLHLASARSDQDEVERRDGEPRSPLQILRGQIELYRIQHQGTPPNQADPWTQMLFTTNVTGTTTRIRDVSRASTDYPLGPYLPDFPVNPANGQSAVNTTPSPAVGWIYKVSGSDYTIQAVNTTGNGVLTY